MLQKSKVAAPRIFSENKKRETMANSYILNRVAEVAGELDVRGRLPPRLYTKDAPTTAEFLITCAKRLLQHYRTTSRHVADIIYMSWLTHQRH